MKILNKEDYEFLIYPLNGNITVGFSTAKNNLNFNKNIPVGIENLKRLKNWFKVDEVVYLNQIHGTMVHTYEDDKGVMNSDGDGIVTEHKNTIIGVFTADCVPIILVDEVQGTIAALHSGWKGTLNNILEKGIKAMMENYGCKIQNMKAFIGPHNKSCCYEVSEELIDIFSGSEIFKGEVINSGRYLDLQRCVEIELLKCGVRLENIISTNLCTYCSDDRKLYSYRKKDESEGRLFSFVFANEED